MPPARSFVHVTAIVMALTSCCLTAAEFTFEQSSGGYKVTVPQSDWNSVIYFYFPTSQTSPEDFKYRTGAQYYYGDVASAVYVATWDKGWWQAAPERSETGYTVNVFFPVKHRPHPFDPNFTLAFGTASLTSGDLAMVSSTGLPLVAYSAISAPPAEAPEPSTWLPLTSALLTLYFRKNRSRLKFSKRESND